MLKCNKRILKSAILNEQSVTRTIKSGSVRASVTSVSRIFDLYIPQITRLKMDTRTN